MGGRIEKARESDGDLERQQKQHQSALITVGFSFMAKKMDSMAKVMGEGACDDVIFRQLDFACPPEKHQHLDVILHKLSDDIMFREQRPEGNARLAWIEDYLATHPTTVIVDAIDSVRKVLDRVTTLKLLAKAYAEHGAAGGMPRVPRFVVLGESPKTNEELLRDKMTFPVICKPIEACGTRGSHTMMVVLDQASMSDVPTPIVVQECHNHSAKLFKVCVVGDDVRVYERSSLPSLPHGLTGSFAFDSQKIYPTIGERFSGTGVDRSMALLCRLGSSFGRVVQTAETVDKLSRMGKLEDVEAMSAATVKTRGQLVPRRQPVSSPPTHRIPLKRRKPEGVENASPPSERAQDIDGKNVSAVGFKDTTKADVSSASQSDAMAGSSEVSPPVISLASARVAAARMRETFGLTLFGFDLIVDEASGETMVIDVNYFPSFKDMEDFPQLLRRLLKDLVVEARHKSAGE